MRLQPSDFGGQRLLATFEGTQARAPDRRQISMPQVLEIGLHVRGPLDGDMTKLHQGEQVAVDAAHRAAGQDNEFQGGPPYLVRRSRLRRGRSMSSESSDWRTPSSWEPSCRRSEALSRNSRGWTPWMTCCASSTNSSSSDELRILRRRNRWKNSEKFSTAVSRKILGWPSSRPDSRSPR